VNPALIVIALLSGTPAQDVDTRLYRGEWEQVLGGLRKQLASTDGGADPAGEARTLVLLARAQVTSNSYHLRDEKLADQVSARALEAAERNKEPGLLADALLSRGRVFYWRAFRDKKWNVAQGFFDRSQKLYAEAKDARGEAEAWFYLGLVEQQQDRLDPGDERFRQGLALARSMKDGVLESFFHRHLAASAEERGQLDEAEKGFVESARLRLDGKACVLSPFAQITLADFYEKANRSREKIPRLLEEAVATATRCGSNPAAIQAHLRLARAAQNPEDRRNHAEQALALAKRFDDEALVQEAAALIL
jgi:tetratricopeptide (TPR) repeat protein